MRDRVTLQEEEGECPDLRLQRWPEELLEVKRDCLRGILSISGNLRNDKSSFFPVEKSPRQAILVWKIDQQCKSYACYHAGKQPLHDEDPSPWCEAC